MRICGANCHKIAPCLCVTDLIRYMPMAQRNRLSLPVPTCAVMWVSLQMISPPSGTHTSRLKLRVLCDKECIGKTTKISYYILRFLPQIVNKHSVFKYKHFITGRSGAFLHMHGERLSIPAHARRTPHHSCSESDTCL